MPPLPHRARALQLLRQTILDLGWKFRLYLPAYLLISGLFLLPPQLLKFFTQESQRIEDLAADRFLTLLASYGVLVAIALWLGVYLSNLAGEWLRLTISVRLREKLLHALHHIRLEALDDASRGDWLTRMTSDLRNCEGFISDSIPEQLRQLVLLVGSAILFAMASGPLALIPCLFAALLMAVNFYLQHRISPALAEARELEGGVFQSLIESFEGLRSIRNAGGEEVVAQRLSDRLQDVFRIGMRIIRRMGALMGANELASQILLTGILCLMAWALSRGSLTVEAILVYPFYLSLFLNAARSLVSSAFEWNRFFIEGGRLGQILHDESTRMEPQKLPVPANSIEEATWKQLTVGWQNAPALFEDLEVSIRSGEILVILGPSGCGKSTLLDVLNGLRTPQAGDLHLKTTGRESIRLMDTPHDLASLVEQRPYLFAGSVRDNLSLGNPQLEDEAMTEVLRELNLDFLFDRGGLDAVIADRAMNLSEGQRYRLALGRALLADRRFLILDEPFAALDETSVDLVLNAIHRRKEAGKGLVLSTHQLPDGLHPDRILQMRGPQPRSDQSTDASS